MTSATTLPQTTDRLAGGTCPMPWLSCTHCGHEWPECATEEACERCNKTPESVRCPVCLQRSGLVAVNRERKPRLRVVAVSAENPVTLTRGIA